MRECPKKINPKKINPKQINPTGDSRSFPAYTKQAVLTQENEPHTFPRSCCLSPVCHPFQFWGKRESQRFPLTQLRRFITCSLFSECFSKLLLTLQLGGFPLLSLQNRPKRRVWPCSAGPQEWVALRVLSSVTRPRPNGR